MRRRCSGARLPRARRIRFRLVNKSVTRSHGHGRIRTTPDRAAPGRPGPGTALPALGGGALVRGRPLRRRPGGLHRRLRDPGPARAGDRLDLRRPRRAPRSAARRAKSSSSSSTGCRSSPCSPSTTSPAAPPTRSGIGVHFTTMIDFDQLRLLRRDADRVAAGAPLRPRRRALVGRRLHPRLHLLLHRPLRHRRRPLGARPARLPALRQAPRHARARRPRDLHRLPRGAALDGRRRRACSTASTGRPPRAGR